MAPGKQQQQQQNMDWTGLYWTGSNQTKRKPTVKKELKIKIK